MAAPWHLIKSFIREATETPEFTPVANISIAYAKLRVIQRGQFETAAVAGGLIQISSQIKDTAFEFAVPADLTTADIMAIAEQALALIEGKTVAQARALLARRKTTMPDFRTFQL